MKKYNLSTSAIRNFLANRIERRERRDTDFLGAQPRKRTQKQKEKSFLSQLLITRTISFILCSYLLLFQGVPSLFGQETDYLLNSSYDGLSWSDFTTKTEQNFAVKYYYLPELTLGLPNVKIEQELPLEQFLNNYLQAKNIYVSIDRQGNIFLTPDKPLTSTIPISIYPNVEENQEENEENGVVNNDFLITNQNFIASIVTIGDKQNSLNKNSATITGYVYDERNESLIGATIFVSETRQGTATDIDGFYSLSLKKGKYNLKIDNLNSSTKEVRIDLLSDGKFDIILENKEVLLDDIVVTSSRNDRVRNAQMGTELLSTESIKEIPLVLGENDILKVSTLLPGVQSVGEGAAGVNVRGSPADQNLFLIDKIPVYNTSHLFGFFSAFNSDVVDEFSLSKGNMPAEFGGRLSSVFNVKAKTGDKNKYKVRGGISPITGRVLVEGPLQREKSSFLLGVRSTYSNYILDLIDNPDFNKSKIFFGDITGKFSFDINKKNSLNVFGYHSLDDINFGGKSQFDNQNSGGSAILTHSFSPRHNVDASIVYSRNTLSVENKEISREAYLQNSTLEHREVKLDFTLLPTDNHRITYGANAIIYDIDRGEFSPSGTESLVEQTILGKEKGFESGIYLSDEWQISPFLTLVGGLRYNLYSFLGPNDVFKYQEGVAKNPSSIQDTLTFGNNERITTHTGLDYRFGASYMVSPDLSFKASYNRTHQYIFLLSNTIALSPTDKWKLTDYNIDPLRGDQYSLGIYTKVFDKKAELSVEGYYKVTKNLVEYRDGADLLVNEFPERDVLQGDLNAYGIEMMLRKSKGRLNGWMNYTYSSSSVTVDQGFSGGQVNFGESYNANYDKPHAVNLVLNFKLNRRLSVSSNVVYATGRPITYPTTVYSQNGIPLINYTARNAYRVPDYFRTDISVKVEGNLKKEKLLHSSWVFSIYNMTGRKNAYNVFFTSESGLVKGFKTSIFAQPIVSITYNFKFGNYDN
ncbi:MAG: hypothetical protein ACI85O_001351 [Saprospiraceae bacterium]|jgi:hypothetical protein